MFISITFKTESCDYYCDMFEVEYVSDIVNELKKCWYVYELGNVCNYWVSNSIDKELNYEIKETISNFIDDLKLENMSNE